MLEFPISTKLSGKKYFLSVYQESVRVMQLYPYSNVQKTPLELLYFGAFKPFL
jgi:hypothetical protein